MASFGGGPGTDAAGLVWAQRELYRDDMLSTTLYDVEGSWKRYMKTLGELFGDGVPLAFQPCDVTKPLAHKANAKVAAAEADLLLFFYVCNETGAGEEDNPRLEFYAGLAEKAKPGAVVVLAAELPSSVALFHRQMGAGTWHTVAMGRAGGVGSVYSGEFTVDQGGDSEYYVVAKVGVSELRWPECEAVPCATQTVVVVD